MLYLKKIIAWLLIFAILIFSLCVPAFATTNPAPTDSRGNFYDWAINADKSPDRPGGTFLGDRPWGSVGGGRPKYDEWVDSLPATGITSSGKLLWQPTFSNVVQVKSYFSPNGSSLESNYTPLDSRISFTSASNGFVCSCVPSDLFSKGACYLSFLVYFSDFPVSGTYFFDSSRGSQWIGSHRIVHGGGGSVEYKTIKSGFLNATHLTSESTLSRSVSGTQIIYSDQYYSASYSFPVFEIIPDSSIDFGSGSEYNINTRPTTITGGNYGIVGDDNQITTVTDNRQIVNETNNTYYNPATGQTQTITDWSYDYSSRTYNVTLDTGDKVSVEYGDQNITIKEGDTSYTIYYIIQGSGSGACAHDWQAGSTVDPTCTASGKTGYTCSKCGETKTEILPALGHDWQVVRTVPTEYDEDGNQTQAGYTLFECSRCGNQYKDEDSTGPPGDDTPDDGGLIAWLNGLIKSLSDNLSGVVDLILQFFREIPKLFGGFTAFLAAVFPFLPDEIMLLLTFGMAALVVVGVIKAIRR